MSPLLSCRMPLLQSKFDPLALWPGAGRIGVAAVQPEDICRDIPVIRRRDLELKNFPRLRTEGRHVADHCRQRMFGIEHVVPMRETPSQCSAKTHTTACNDKGHAINIMLDRISYTLFPFVNRGVLPARRPTRLETARSTGHPMSAILCRILYTLRTQKRGGESFPAMWDANTNAAGMFCDQVVDPIILLTRRQLRTWRYHCP